MKRLVILTTVLLVSCGSEYDPYTPLEPTYTPPPKDYVPQVDAAVASIYDEFIQECRDRDSKLCLARMTRLEYVKVVDEATLRKDKGSENRAGVCYTWTDDQGRLAKAQIQILDAKWELEVLRGLVYHELGHCLLAKDHTCEIDAPGCAEKKYKPRPQMMYPYVYGLQTYIDFWQVMVDDLFGAVAATLSLTDDAEPTGKLTKHTVE